VETAKRVNEFRLPDAPQSQVRHSDCQNVDALGEAALFALSLLQTENDLCTLIWCAVAWLFRSRRHRKQKSLSLSLKEDALMPCAPSPILGGHTTDGLNKSFWIAGRFCVFAPRCN